MDISTLFSIDTWLICLIILLTMMVCIWLGSLIGEKKFKGEYAENSANKTIIGSVFGLMAFLLAFTFSMSGARYESRRTASIAEANAIGTAMLRSDLYSEPDRNAFRADFKNYLQARIDYLASPWDDTKLKAIQKRQEVAAKSLWARAMRLTVNPPSIIPSNQMIPALNEMFDSATDNDYSELMRVPESIVIMLFILSFVSAFFMGYSSAEKGKLDWYVAFGFCFLSVLVLFITLDLDRPRRGLIQLETSHRAITSLMDGLKD